MLVRLRKSQRLRAGWCIALAYLFCVLAPSLSFAFTDGSIAAPCLIEDLGLDAHVHEQAHEQHAHEQHSHEGHDASMMHDHVHSASMLGAGTTIQTDATLPVKTPNKHSDTHCCGLITISAIPAAEIVLIKPTAIATLCEPENYRDFADNAPPGLYRPPIS